MAGANGGDGREVGSGGGGGGAGSVGGNGGAGAISRFLGSPRFSERGANASMLGGAGGGGGGGAVDEGTISVELILNVPSRFLRDGASGGFGFTTGSGGGGGAGGFIRIESSVPFYVDRALGEPAGGLGGDGGNGGGSGIGGDGGDGGRGLIVTFRAPGPDASFGANSPFGVNVPFLGVFDNTTIRGGPGGLVAAD